MKAESSTAPTVSLVRTCGSPELPAGINGQSFSNPADRRFSTMASCSQETNLFSAIVWFPLCTHSFGSSSYKIPSISMETCPNCYLEVISFHEELGFGAAGNI